MRKPNNHNDIRDSDSFFCEIEQNEDFHKRVRADDDKDPEMQEPRNAHEKVQVTIELTR